MLVLEVRDASGVQALARGRLEADPIAYPSGQREGRAAHRALGEVGRRITIGAQHARKPNESGDAAIAPTLVVDDHVADRGIVRQQRRRRRRHQDVHRPACADVRNQRRGEDRVAEERGLDHE